MGSASALSSMQRVLEAHGDELIQELKEQYNSKLVKDFSLGVDESCYGLTPTVTLIDGTVFVLEKYDIDDLADRFPDCEIGY